MTGIPNHYGSLGLGSQASQDEIRDAYRRRVKSCHPDMTGSPEETEDFRAAREAYEVLSDPEKRQEYDARRRRDSLKQRPQKQGQTFHRQFAEADIDLVLSPIEAARGGCFRIPLSSAREEGCLFCSAFQGFFPGPCPFCGARTGGVSEAVIDLPPGVANGTQFVLEGTVIVIRIENII
jgi:curved DNA-binding protein CbpA